MLKFLQNVIFGTACPKAENTMKIGNRRGSPIKCLSLRRLRIRAGFALKAAADSLMRKHFSVSLRQKPAARSLFLLKLDLVSP